MAVEHHLDAWLAELELNRHVVEALRDALLENDELVGDEITRVIDEAVRRSA